MCRSISVPKRRISQKGFFCGEKKMCKIGRRTGKLNNIKPKSCDRFVKYIKYIFSSLLIILFLFPLFLELFYGTDYTLDSFYVIIIDIFFLWNPQVCHVTWNWVSQLCNRLLRVFILLGPDVLPFEGLRNLNPNCN